MSPRDSLKAAIRALDELVDAHDQVPQEAAEDAVKEIRVYLAACVVTRCPRVQPGVSAGSFDEARTLYYGEGHGFLGRHR